MTVRVLESVVRRSGLAVRPVDLATGAPVVDGIEATLWPQAAPLAKVVGRPATASGIIGFPSLPGLASYEDGSTSRAEWFASPVVHPPQPFVLCVVDRRGRYLPVVRTVLVPVEQAVDVALPSAPATPAPAGFGLVVGQVVRQADGVAAAWALVRVTSGSTVAGGVSDRRGMFSVAVPLAAAPVAGGGPASPMAWLVSVSVRYRPADQAHAPGSEPDDPPAFESIVNQPSALVVDDGILVADVDRLLTRSTPLVVASAAVPPPSVLLVRPSP